MTLVKSMIASNWAYSEWATTTLLNACVALSPAELSRDLGLSHGSLLLTFRHIYISERFWAGCLIGNEIPQFDTIAPEPVPQDLRIERLASDWIPLWQIVGTWLDSLAEQDLAETLRCPFTAERVFHFPRWELVSHLVNHGTLHRGQIVGMLRVLGVKPPNVDLMTYIQFR